MKSKDQILLEEVYQKINEQFSLTESLDPRISKFSHIFIKNLKNILNSDVPKDIKFVSILNTVAEYSIPIETITGDAESDGHLQEGFQVARAALDYLEEFKNKFSNFSIIEMIRMIRNMGKFLEAHEKGEIGGLELIELLVTSWDHFKKTSGYKE